MLLVICIAIAIVSCIPSKSNIIGGTDAKRGDNPHMCSLQVRGSGHSCGASIIGDQWAITAAHCVFGETPKTLYLRCSTLEHAKPGRDYNLTDLSVHKQFDGYHYDLALLKIQGKFQLGSPDMDKIQLAAPGSNVTVGSLLTVTGWGIYNLTDRKLSPKLRTVDVPVVDWLKCVDAYKRNKMNVTQDEFCAGYDQGGKDSCTSDSGGPIKYQNTLVGIVSWGADCAQPNYPGAYERVGLFRDWIKQISGI
ncbi:mite allergen Der p 3-like [Oppia nitens]|uniref:mite allergen Der p 3-like n=1 Tax=Oppia nitens TaxID=1686743 RepID=UPI0023DC43F3|nr:mite allergen Der p 3-like [Oppia nitens]